MSPGRRVLVRACLHRAGLWPCLWGFILITLASMRRHSTLWTAPFPSQGVQNVATVEKLNWAQASLQACKHACVYFSALNYGFDKLPQAPVTVSSLTWWAVPWNFKPNNPLPTLRCFFWEYFTTQRETKAGESPMDVCFSPSVKFHSSWLRDLSLPLLLSVPQSSLSISFLLELNVVLP